MNCALFFGWLRRFNVYVTHERRHVLLLIDSSSAYGRPENLLELSNVEMIFFPPNTTAKLQPFDARIIGALKVSYCDFQLERALHLSDEVATKDISKLDGITVMQVLSRI